MVPCLAQTTKVVVDRGDRRSAGKTGDRIFISQPYNRNLNYPDNEHAKVRIEFCLLAFANTLNLVGWIVVRVNAVTV